MKNRSKPESGESRGTPATGDLRRDTKPLRREAGSELDWLTRRRTLIAVMLGSLALLAAALAGWWYLTGGLTNGRDQDIPLTPPVSLESLATEYPELSTLLQDPKLDSVYKEFLLAYQTGGEEAALELARTRGLLNANGDLRLTLELDTTDTAALEAELEASWIEVTAVSGNLMDIVLPLERLDMFMSAGTVDDFLSGITTLEHVVRIRLPQVDIEDSFEQSLIPVLTFPAPGTPTPVPTEANSNRRMLVMGILLCGAAPILFGLGVVLLLFGMGYMRRKPAGSRQPPAAQPLAGRAHPAPVETAAASAHPPSLAPMPSSPVSQPQPGIAAPVIEDKGGSAVQPLSSSQKAPLADETASLVCQHCGRVNRHRARFCLLCGMRLTDKPAADIENPVTTTAAENQVEEAPSYCWNCGCMLRLGARFCPNCGDPI